MRRFNGRDADRATEVLEILGREEQMSEDLIRLEAQLDRYREMAQNAGLLGRDDMTTDPLPVIQMFLPSGE
jgi:hypothetical protein